MTFKGKTVVVTGAAGNLGRAVARAFFGQGATLVLLDRETQPLAAEFGASDRVHLLAVDLLDPASLDRGLQPFGKVDVLCNLAGGFRMGPPVHETPAQTWDFLMDLNARSVLHSASAVVPRLLAAGGGSIVNVGAASAFRGQAGMGAYCASKSAVMRLSESMAAELADRSIRVNCVVPTIIDTPQNRADMPGADTSKWVKPDELAAVILFLSSPAASAVSGACIPVGR